MSDYSEEQQEQQGGASSNGGRFGGPKATLERLADFNISGKFSINLRILLEPIGFLRIIAVVLCLLAFSLTAGFGSNGSSNQAFCDSVTNITYTVTLTWSYPYRTNSFAFSYNPALNSTAPDTCTTETALKTFSGSAEYFVFMSTVSFLYAIIALVVYVLFYVPRYDIAKYISVADLIATCVLIFFFFFADIAWIAGSSQLQGYTGDILSARLSNANCMPCTGGTIPPPETQTFAQLSVSLLFGWVALLVLIATIWFIYKDTIIHLNRMGPLYQLSFVRRRLDKSSTDSEGEKERSYSPEVGMQQVEQQQEESPDDQDKW